MSASGTVVITAGPSYEPIDEVRRITNSSSGELGVMLANRFAKAEYRAICLLGTGAVVRGPLEEGVRRVAFGTNGELLDRLAALAGEGPVLGVFQAAALCDFRLARIDGAGGASVGSAKISSRQGEITLVLAPALKVISKLRGLFPRSAVVGWKYELEGSRDDVVAKGRRQLAENETDLCVLNGRAYGPGFGLLDRGGKIREVPGKSVLCDCLVEWLAHFRR